ncbi:L-carnitine CoA-transferase [Endozoicomonas sp. (ex Bugula neritina AB1)]|nr:L-carnitine CoA-transferase [Endozoicomonas sp. (ex Bugula neritina AB1)]
MSKKVSTPEFGPLHGVSVVFSALEIAGPFPAQMMAEWGAEVIWIEHTKYDDTIRVQKNYRELSRRNLHSLSINIFSDEGKEAFLKLIETADIFIESSKGPAFARRGITDELLWEHNKSLVIVHLSGYGQYGDDNYINLPSYDHIACAFSGFLVQNGDQEQPMVPFPYTADYVGGFTVLSSALAALYNAKRTGEGESIDVAMYESLLRVSQYYMADYFNNGTLYPRPTKGKDPTQVGCGVYRCSDGFITMAWVGGPQVKRLLELLKMDHILGTEEFPEGIPGIRADSSVGSDLEAKLDALFIEKTIEETLELMQSMGVAVTKMLTIPELEDHPQYVARENIVEWETMSGEKTKGANVIPKFKKNPGQIWRGMPSRGMDSAAILSDLGYSDQEIHGLAEVGAVKLAE